MTPSSIKQALQEIVSDATKNDSEIHHSGDTQVEQDISMSIDRLTILKRIKDLIAQIPDEQ